MKLTISAISIKLQKGTSRKCIKSRSKKPGKKEFNHIPVISIFVRKQKEKNNERLTMGNRSSQEVLINRSQGECKL